MFVVFVRTLLVYFILMFSMRIGGKRQVGQMQITELVSVLVLSEVAALPIGDTDIPITFSLIPVLTILCIEMITAFAVSKNKKLRKVFDGKPQLIICKGKLSEKALGSLPLGIEEFISEARIKGISDISDIEYAIIEENGELSVFSKSDVGRNGLAHVVISDGKINRFGLEMAGITEDEVTRKLSERNITFGQILLYTVDDSGGENLILKEDGQKKSGFTKP